MRLIKVIISHNRVAVEGKPIWSVKETCILRNISSACFLRFTCFGCRMCPGT